MKRQTNNKGFTIIEVVLVLAIAALIFLVVFLAVPALQRSQRDQQRRSDLGRLQTAIVNYTSNHQGSLPPTVDNAWVYRYVRSNGNDKFEDPRGNTNVHSGTPQYVVTQQGTPAAPAAATPINAVTAWTNNAMIYRPGHLCDPSSSTAYTTTTGATNRMFAVLVNLEGGDVACQDNR